ncbi:hypothetical protein QKW35_17425 [Pontibacterium granulatum]|nr:hypothetical protein [Pontibacterium granulatum]MDI3326164.1 hypothetical protein [Pontibacterium granulatum]
MLRIGLLLLIVPGVVMMGLYLNELSAVKECLGAGGSYDYVNAVCDQTQTHAFSPFMVRNPLLVNGGMLLSVVGLFCCLAGLYTRAR